MPHAFLNSASAAPLVFCQKVAFETRKMAMRAVGNVPSERARMVQTGHGKPRTTLRPYLCKHCEQWHIGHS